MVEKFTMQWKMEKNGDLGLNNRLCFLQKHDIHQTFSIIRPAQLLVLHHLSKQQFKFCYILESTGVNHSLSQGHAKASHKCENQDWETQKGALSSAEDILLLIYSWYLLLL